MTPTTKRQKQLLHNWLNEYMPREVAELTAKTGIRIIPDKDRKRVLQLRAEAYEEKVRIAQQWRTDLAARLNIDDDDITKATATILELIEQSLANQEPVRLTNFGDFLITDGEKPRFYFRACESWKRELNEPLYAAEIGLVNRPARARLQRITASPEMSTDDQDLSLENEDIEDQP